MYLPVPGIEPTSSEFLDKCVTRKATVADVLSYAKFGKHMYRQPLESPKTSLFLLYSVQNNEIINK